METRPTAVSHILTVPYPARGHINPMMNLCKTIATKQPNILITFVVTEEWLGLIGNDSKPENIHFATIPNVLPSEHIRARKFLEFFEAVMINMEGPFEQVLDRIRQPPSVILTDFMLFWAVKIGNRRNIPVALLTTCSTTAFESFFRTLRRTPAELPEKRDDRIDRIPKNPAEGSGDRTEPGKEGILRQWILVVYSWVPKAQYLFFASVEELEQEAFDGVRSQLSIPVYAVGPNIPYFQLGNKPFLNPKQDGVDYLQWLDSQVTASVLYISFGSYHSVSTTQMNEIAAALCTSGVRFLWVARDESARLIELVGSNGIVVPWCDQLRVLTHHSVGGFWTHCGWGSVMEGIFAGVPFLASPIAMDQDVNCKLIVEDWKVGWRVDLEIRSKIEGLVLKFMDLQDDESKAIRRRAKGVQEMCQQAIRSDGSSQLNLIDFINDILQGHGH